MAAGLFFRSTRILKGSAPSPYLLPPPSSTPLNDSSLQLAWHHCGYREVSEIVFLSIVVEQNGWVCTLFCLDTHKAVDHNPALLVCLELLGWGLQLQQQLHLHDGQPPALHIHHGAWHCSTRPTAAPQSLAAGRYLRAHHSSALNDS